MFAWLNFKSVSLSAAAFGFCAALPTLAIANDKIESLQRELEALKAEQARLNEKISTVETMMNSLELGEPEALALTPPAPAASVKAPQPAPSATAAAPLVSASPIVISGDLRLRHEANFGDEDARDRNRAVMRARLRARYAVSDKIKVGAEIVTGDADDPNSDYFTVSGFADNFEVSLSQLYANFSLSDLEIFGGKFPQPFRSTDLVWDGDVNPQGAAARWRRSLNEGGAFTATGIYFIIDESAAGRGSDMLGGQIALDARVGEWRLDLSGAYYDYRLHDLGSADAGDFRSNILTATGEYLSDFDIVDLIFGLTYDGFGPHWPLRLRGDYVRNLGAENSEDTGFGFDIAAGRTKTPGDWRLSYGYMQTDVDAVLAAFSNDNFAIATNYKAHILTLDYTPVDHLVLNATLYAYRPLDPDFAGENLPEDWLQRVRLNATVGF